MTHEELEQLSKDELIEVILRQQAIVAHLAWWLSTLKAQVKALSKPAKTSDNSSVPPSKGHKANRKRDKPARKRGPKPGHVGRSRSRQKPDVVIECRRKVCQGCGADLSQAGHKQVGSSQIVEIPPIKPVVIEARRYEVECPLCGKKQAADYPAGLESERVFGPHLEALISYLHQVHHLSYERLEEVFAEVFGLSISQGALSNSVHRTGKRLLSQAEMIKEDICRSPVIGSDETGARVDGHNEWQWVFQTPQACYHVIVPSRAAAVIAQVLGPAEPEVWVSDLFSAQKKHPAKEHQICHAHQLRDLQYAIDAERCAFAYRMQRLLLRAKGLATHRDTLPDEIYRWQVRDIEQACDDLLQCPVSSEQGRKMQRRFLKYRDCLFIFLYRADVPFDNNASERDLRNSVVHRKVSGGFRSRWGAETFATVATVVGTARKRGKQILATLQEAIGPPIPVTLVYQPP